MKLSSLRAKGEDDECCVIEPDSKTPRNYLIYKKNDKLNTKSLFGRLSYEFSHNNDYLYTFLIGEKLYRVRSYDLRNRRLTIIGTIEFNSPVQSNENSPETLFEVIDLFSESTKVYHVTVNDKKEHLGYLAIVILLDLHECRQI